MATEADRYRQMVTGGYRRSGMTLDELLVLAARWSPHLPGCTGEVLWTQIWAESRWKQNQLGDHIDPVGPEVTSEQHAIPAAM